MDFKDLVILENNKHKICRSSDYNFIFNKENGFFARWGSTKEEDPQYGPAPEIADIEICAGECLGKCSFCYKCNNISNEKQNMSLVTFKKIFNKLPKTLTQIAFGITDIYANPDFFKIMEYTKNHNVIPNYTTHGLDMDNYAIKRTVELCGAIAVSLVKREQSYNIINSLVEYGMKQVNIHHVLCEEHYDDTFKIIDDIKNDNRLEGLNAIVFLQYKDKNPYSNCHSLLDINKYRKIIDYCTKKEINYGFDSCSAPIYIESIKNKSNKKQLEQYAESCESLRMSIYINYKGDVFPCSFCEETQGWQTGINIIENNDFIKDVWLNDKIVQWRKKLIDTMQNGCCHCPVYNLNFKK